MPASPPCARHCPRDTPSHSSSRPTPAPPAPPAPPQSLGFPASKYNGGKGTIVDSGTTDTYLPSQFNDKFTELFKDISGVKFSSGNVALSSSELARMPNVLFTFEGTDGKPFTILMPWTNYVDSVGGGKYAFRIYLTEGSGIVLGANFMTGMDVVFDQVRALVYGPLPAPPLLCMLRRGR